VRLRNLHTSPNDRLGKPTGLLGKLKSSLVPFLPVMSCVFPWMPFAPRAFCRWRQKPLGYMCRRPRSCPQFTIAPMSTLCGPRLRWSLGRSVALPDNAELCADGGRPSAIKWIPLPPLPRTDSGQVTSQGAMNSASWMFFQLHSMSADHFISNLYSCDMA
jgi:hypothetical protein